MRIGANQTTVPRPYYDILIELNEATDVNDVITIDALHLICKVLYCKKFDKDFKDIMTNLMKHAEDVGFKKIDSRIQIRQKFKRLFIEVESKALQKIRACKPVQLTVRQAIVEIKYNQKENNGNGNGHDNISDMVEESTLGLQ